MASNSNNESDTPYFLRSQSTDGTINSIQPRSILSNSTPLPSLNRTTSLITTNGLVRGNFQRRTAEGARQLRDNFNNVIREIQPLVETARAVNISNLLNRPQSEPNMQVPNNSTPNSFVVNFDEPVIQSTENPPPPAAILENPNPNENTTNNENPVRDNEDLANNAEAQQALGIIQKYFPFILILLVKGLYDHQEGILNFIILFSIFTYGNSTLKKEATKQNRRNLFKLFMVVVYILIGILFIHFIFDEEKLYLNLIFIRIYDKPLSVWDLLWFVGITDFILKLITVLIKVLFTMLPAFVIRFEKRGKIFLFMEAVSQLYRSLATIQPWLYYLLESYQGSEKILGVFLAAFYMVSKGADLMAKLKLLKMAIFKLIQNVTVGSMPSKEQIQTAGEHCPICHDEYDSPVLLQCRHIFCESCVTTWFDREQTCPLCRSKIVDDPSWRDGSTSFFLQLF